MEYVESNESARDDTAEPRTAKPARNASAAPEDSAHSNAPQRARAWPHTAIERQIAATATRGTGERAHTAGASHERRRKSDRRSHRFGFGSFLVLLWLVTVGLIVLFTDFGRTVQKAVSDAPHAVEQAVARVTAPADSAPADTMPARTANSRPAPASAASAPATQTAAAAAQRDNASATAAISAPSTEAISIPIADVSLRTRPELLEQLVQVYRAQLAADPQDASTRAALERLHERSLSEIQTLITDGYVSTASRSLEIVSRLFPELSDNVRYKYLVARTEYMRRDMPDEAAPAGDQRLAVDPQREQGTAMIAGATSKNVATPAASSVATAAAAPTVASPKPLISPTAAGSPTVAGSASAATETETSARSPVSSKPEIRSVSIMPGTMEEGRFIPRDGGNVFMVELSYSNFAKAFVEQNEATLITLLGVPDEPLVLAEVPTTISADRGTKSFAIETDNVRGYAGGKFQLNFMLNDEFLTSRTLRLSRPR